VGISTAATPGELRAHHHREQPATKRTANRQIEFGRFGCRGKFLKICDVIYLEIRRSWVTP